ncbi:hypothetical protein COV19_06140 [Candidatus Woesearchaeota archaeon CG10_big_fil_rev_8_21_14_0_10_44_13]|nr:MAG: hypothetical protein COV19_06140 [Candidatus Woesearchaeota archaeon CG10_big_fil_rev_8_21_14_0_10_44_13]
MQEAVNKDVNITYETLFEILRREKSREDLQELQESFFQDVIDYLRDKTRIMETSQGKLFSEEEMEKTRVQIMNIRKILKELYERREKKIIYMALNKSRTKTNIINTSVLLKEEQELYESVNDVLDRFREGILTNVLDKKMPSIRKNDVSSANGMQGMQANNAPNNGYDQPGSDVSAVSAGASDIPGSSPGDAELKPKEIKKEAMANKKTKTVRFLNPMPKFIGPDMVIYGPFEEEDIASLPEAAANVLIEKGRAEVMENGNGA